MSLSSSGSGREVLNGIIQGNYLFPQLRDGALILGGAALTKHLLDGSLQLTACGEALRVPSAEDLVAFGHAAGQAHKRYRVDLPFKGLDTSETAKNTPGRRLTDMHLTYQFGRLRGATLEAMAKFAWSATSISRSAGRSVAAQALFGMPEHRPAAATLTSMWDMAAQFFSEHDTLKWSEAYRDEIAVTGSISDANEAFEATRAVAARTSLALSHCVFQAIDMPTLSQQLGGPFHYQWTIDFIKMNMSDEIDYLMPFLPQAVDATRRSGSL